MPARPAAYLQRSADFRSATMSPESRTTPQVRKCNNANTVRVYSVDHLVGETSDQNSAGLEIPKRRSSFRKLSDSIQGSHDRVKELKPRPARRSSYQLTAAANSSAAGLAV